MSSFKLEKNDRTDAEREKDKLRQKVKNVPMDTSFSEDYGPVQCKIQINPTAVKVEEVNWKKWNRCLGIISEDPGECHMLMRPGPQRENEADVQWHLLKLKNPLSQSTLAS
ncbi:hypothetical protein Baya_5664 [Bagarius yarrelli]|uniref:Uncharacterized protein n=1 Tax=Bagarius yarrelli TaxID=175774 RepID=A0A556TY63_BAGYA|nr:hypothetical protein Baya_5664 [Bagarius yarrelli]